MDKDLIITTEIGEKIVNPEAVKKIKDSGFCVIPDSLLRQLLDDELELIKLKYQNHKRRRIGKW